MFLNDFSLFGLPKQKHKTKWKNNREFENWYRKLVNMSMSVYRWNDLPETCDKWIIEYALLMYGKVCIAKDNTYGIVSLPCQETNRYNLYGYSDSIIAYGFNGFNQEYKCYMPGTDNTDAQAIMMYDNPSRYPYNFYLLSTAERLSDNIRAIDVALNKLKNPYWISCNQTQLDSVKKTLSDISDNDNAVITSKSLSPNDFQILPTASNPNILDGMWDNFNNTYDLFKEIIGINNNHQKDKKERLITDEVNSNNFITDMFLDIRLQQRKDFCDIVNSLFGTNISVELSESFQRFQEMMMEVDTYEKSNSDEGKQQDQNNR